MFGLNLLGLGPVGMIAGTNPQPGLNSSPTDLSALSQLLAKLQAERAAGPHNATVASPSPAPASPAAPAVAPGAAPVVGADGGALSNIADAIKAFKTPPPQALTPGSAVPGAAGPTSVGGPNGPTPLVNPSNAAPSPLDNAPWPAGPVGAPLSPNAQVSQAFGALPPSTPTDQANGQDLLQKYMTYFNNKDNPDS